MAQPDTQISQTAEKFPALHTLVSHCEKQLQNFSSKIRSWSEGRHSSYDPGGVYLDKAVVESGSISSSDSLQTKEKQRHRSDVEPEPKRSPDLSKCHSMLPSHYCSSPTSIRWQKLLRGAPHSLCVVQPDAPGARLKKLEEATSSKEDDRRCPGVRFSSVPFASIRSPELVNHPPLPNVSSNQGQDGSHDGNASPVVPIADRLEYIRSSALSTLLRVSRSASLPEPQVKVSQWEPLQGDTVAVLITIAPPRGPVDCMQLAIRSRIPVFGPLVKVAVEKQDVPAFPRGGNRSWRALIPTTPLDTSGTRELQVLVQDGRHAPYDRVIYLKNRDYLIEKIRLPQHKAGLIGGATDMELAAMQSLRALRSQKQLWDGPFLRPSEGIVTTGYGVQRYYNEKFAEGYYHRGVDFGANPGSPVRSPAGARVVLVGREEDGYRLHGNCVGLDHGQGVVSTMLHLESIQVAEGEFVKAGQVLGTVGETGIATGPHLHWGLYVNGECIDPDSWMRQQFWL